MITTSAAIPDFSLAYYSGDRKTGAIAIVDRKNGKTTAKNLDISPETGLDKTLKPVIIGMTEDRRVILLDPQTKKIQSVAVLPADAFPAHKYPDPTSNRAWYMNDGDKETGNDTLNCGNKGSSVTVVENTDNPAARFLKTICVGRGHHQASFAYPTPRAPEVLPTAYISNLKDGTLNVIGNDPGNAATYLKVTAVINLGEADKEELPSGGVPNNSFPHGLVYSPVSGRVYILKNGYGTMSVIDPVANAIEKTIPFNGHSNLFITPDGNYIIGRGADRKSDPEHVIARLSVLDVLNDRIVDTADLADIYISQYYFNADGSKLYLTTGSSGNDQQLANLKQDSLLIFDMAALPKLKLIKEFKLGSPAGSLAFLNQDGRTQLVFSSNSEEGTVTVISGEDDMVLEKINITSGDPHSRILAVAG